MPTIRNNHTGGMKKIDRSITDSRNIRCREKVERLRAYTRRAHAHLRTFKRVPGATQCWFIGSRSR